MIKKFIFILSVCFLINPCFAVVQDKYPFVSTIEQKLFGANFVNEEINGRLSRIEKNVFGTTYNGTPVARINKLKIVFGQTDKKVVPIKKVQNKTAKTSNIPKNIKKEDPAVQYTVVNELEKKVLNKTFVKDSIYNRLSRLETVVFNKSMNGPLSERVENLKIAVYGNNKPSKNSDFTIPQNDAAQLSDQSINLLLEKMERDTLNQAYPSETVETRLSRLEMKLFNSTSPEDPVNDRIERLSAVITAQPTNELYKDMSTVRQYQDLTTKVSAAAILLLIIKGMLF